MCILTIFFLPNTVFGQAPSFVTSGLPDNFWYRAQGGDCTYGPAANPYIAELNTAMIWFLNPYGNDVPTPDALAVSDYAGNGNLDGGVAFLDINSGQKYQIDYSQVCPGPAPGIMGKSPDITIGNSLLAPTTDFLVAAAYVLPGGEPQIDYYNVHYNFLIGTYNAAYRGSTTFSGFTSQTIHVDVIAQANNTAATGQPFCDSFAFVFDDIVRGVFYLGEASLNNPPSLITIASPIISFNGVSPDVAGIQRKQPTCNGCAPTVHDVAMITYTDAAAQNLYYNEYDFTSGGSPGSSLLDNLSLTGAEFLYPRIDGPDDYNINSPSPSKAYYEVVVQRDNLTPDMDTYDVTTTPDFAAAKACMGYSNYYYAPTVAFGTNNNTEYCVAHGTDRTFPGYTTYNTVMEPINWTNGNVLASPNDYYLVNYNAFPAHGTVNGNYLTGISTPVNNTSDQTFVAWSTFESTPPYYSIGYSSVYYKTTRYSGLPPYHFREAGTTDVGNNPLPAEWKVYPNPAAGMVLVTNPFAYAVHYTMTDMLGRIVQNGTISSGTQQINMTSLAPGSYSLNCYYDGRSVFNSLLIKE